MIIKTIIVTLGFLFVASLGFAQTQLSNDFNNATEMYVNTECIFETYRYNHDFGSDLPDLKCDRMYPGVSSYFIFKITENSSLTLKIQLETEKFFGLAFYTLQNGEYVELKCDTYKSTEGELKIYWDEGLANVDIIARFWIMGELGSGEVDICLSSERQNLQPKVLNVSTTQYTVQELVQEVLITGCLTASNITFTGNSAQIGYFSNAIPGLDFSSGVILSSGRVTDAPGPNTSGSTSTSFGGAGDPQLNSLIPGYTTRDAAVLEFDFVPASDMLEFQYVFASEEYPEYAPPNTSTYNDVFGFFISGGPENYNNVNVALIPGTVTPVSINNVNAVTNSQYYINNQGGADMEYDGFTVTFTASKPVTACATYHIKLAVADVGDQLYDSAVFLKANSFASGESFVVESYNAWSPSLSVMRGCTNYVKFCRTTAIPLSQPVPVELFISGTAVMGVDYSAIPTNFQIPAGQECVTIEFEAYDTGVLGDATIVLSFDSGCPCDIEMAEHVITLVDPFLIDASITGSGPICVGETTSLSVNVIANDMTYVDIVWSTGVEDVTTINVSPTSTTTYTCNVIYPCDTITLETTVVVAQLPVVDLGSDFSVEAVTANLNANMSPGNTGYWTVISGPGNATISPINSPNATVTVDTYGTYSFSWTETSLAPNCVDSDIINVTFFHVPIADLEASPILCFGDNTIITFTGEAIPGFATFNWDFGSGTIVDGTGQGPYIVNFGTPGSHSVSVTVTEAGMTSSNSVNVYVPYPISATLTTNDASCYQTCDGSASVSVTGGTPPYTYSWGANVINNLCAGNYGLTITDNNACEYITSFTIDEPSALTSSVTVQTNQICSTPGSATVLGSGGTSPYAYSWPANAGGVSGNTASNLIAGTYDVTVRDANSCSIVQPVIIIDEGNMSAVATVNTNVSCYGGNNGSINIVITDGSPAYTINWGSGNATTSSNNYTITDLVAGTYIISVTDINSCQTILTATITEPALLQASSSATAILCNGDNSTVTVSASGGTLPYTGTGNFTRSAGTYSFTVTDAKGCTAETNITITQPTQLVASSSYTPILCYGESSTVTVSATGGTGAYTGTGTYTVSAGTHSYTVTDANGCTSATSVTISQPSLLVANSTGDNVLCYGGTTTVNVTASGGTGAYSGTGIMTNISAGTHSFTVTDANNCSAVTNITITEPPLLQASSSATDIACYGGTSTVTVSATGGTGSYTGTGTFTETAGTHSYTVTDANGCTATTSVTITDPSQLVASSTFTPILCYGETSTVTVSATGGTGTYSGIGEYVVNAGNYSYTVTDANGCASVTNGTISQPSLLVVSSTANNVLCNGGTTAVNVIASGGTAPYFGAGVITNISAGTYSFTVTDLNNCSAVTNITISEPPLLVASSSAGNILCNGGTTAVTVTATGGTLPYSGTGVMNNISSGTYAYIVTDANNCTATTNISISEPPLLLANANAGDILCYGGTTTVNVTASGGTVPYFGIGAINNISSGTYSYVVEDANGCLATANITITEPSQLMLKAVVDKNVSCNGLADGQATASATGGTEPYVFQWNNPSFSYGTTTNQLPAGTWTVNVTDNNNCMAQKSVTIVEPEVLLVTVNTSDVLCYGESTGSANAVVTGGTYPYYYSWSHGGQITSAITNLSAGVYTLTVKDANDCQAVVSAVITQSPELNISLEVSPAVCGSYGGSIVATVVGGSPDYQYMWSTSTTQDNIQNLVPGNYSITVRDTHMCTKTQSIDVGIYGSINAEINELNSIKCFGNQEGALQAVSSNGKYPLNFEWNTGATNSTITDLGIGFYNVIITDAWGCVGGTSYVLVGPTQIVAHADIQNVSCFGLADGEISTQVVGGTPPYTYLWSNAQPSTSISGLQAGSYSLTLYDSVGCQEIETYEITQPDKLKIDLVVKDILCYGNNDGGIKINATGGTQPYSYELAIEDSVLIGQLHSPLGTGNYVAYVRDRNSCLDSALVMITSPAPLEGSYIFESPSCNGARDGYIEITVTGGVEPYLYSNNYFTADIALLSGLGAGNFNVTVTDANDCRIEFEEIFLAESDIECLKIPNAFTPNGDGINDTWIIENIKMFPGARIFVFNRWGQEVWMGYPDEEWDGTYRNSKPMPAGTYLYVIELYNGTKPYTGTVSLIY